MLIIYAANLHILILLVGFYLGVLNLFFFFGTLVSEGSRPRDSRVREYGLEHPPSPEKNRRSVTRARFTAHRNALAQCARSHAESQL